MAKQFAFVKEGEVIDYTAAADIAVGDVVPMVNGCGVALAAIANGATGSVLIDGVGDIPSDTGAAWVVGDLIYWDDTANVGTKTSTSNVALGFAVQAKASAGTSARVKLQFKL